MIMHKAFHLIDDRDMSKKERGRVSDEYCIDISIQDLEEYIKEQHKNKKKTIKTGKQKIGRKTTGEKNADVDKKDKSQKKN